MPNRSYALEWLEIAKRDLSTAELLIREKHFTDSIAIQKDIPVQDTAHLHDQKLRNIISLLHIVLMKFRDF